MNQTTSDLRCYFCEQRCDDTVYGSNGLCETCYNASCKKIRLGSRIAVSLAIAALLATPYHGLSQTPSEDAHEIDITIPPGCVYAGETGEGFPAITCQDGTYYFDLDGIDGALGTVGDGRLVKTNPDWVR